MNCSAAALASATRSDAAVLASATRSTRWPWRRDPLAAVALASATRSAAVACASATRSEAAAWRRRPAPGAGATSAFRHRASLANLDHARWHFVTLAPADATSSVADGRRTPPASRMLSVTCPELPRADPRPGEPPRRRAAHRCAGGASAPAAASASRPIERRERRAAARPQARRRAPALRPRPSSAPRCCARPTSARCRAADVEALVDRIEPAVERRRRRARRGADRRALPRGPARARHGRLPAVRSERSPTRRTRRFRGARRRAGSVRAAREDASSSPAEAASRRGLDEQNRCKRRTNRERGTDGRAPLHDPRRPPLRRGRVGAPRRA